MKSNIIICILVICIQVLFSDCSTNNKPENLKNDTIKINSIDIDSLHIDQKIYYSLPSPDEIIGFLKKANIFYKKELLHSWNDCDNYIDIKSQALNMGIYSTDLAYSAYFGKKTESYEYFGVLQNLGYKLNISSAFDESYLQRIKNNLLNSDSMITLSSEGHLKISEFLSNSGKEYILALISSGTLIESLYLSINQVDKYSENKIIIEKITDYESTFENLKNYLEQFKQNKGIEEILPEIDKLNIIFSAQKSDKSSKTSVTKKGNKLVIGGNKKQMISENQYTELKKTVEFIRNRFIEH